MKKTKQKLALEREIIKALVTELQHAHLQEVRGGSFLATCSDPPRCQSITIKSVGEN